MVLIHFFSGSNWNSPSMINDGNFKNKVCKEVEDKSKDNYLEIKFDNRNQVDDKIVWELGGGILSFHSWWYFIPFFPGCPDILSLYPFTLDMINIDRQLIQSFLSYKIAKKNNLEIYFIFLFKYSTALVKTLLALILLCNKLITQY